MTEHPLDAAAVEAAAEVLRPVVRRTELEHSPRLSALVGSTVLLKRENRQITRSYKVRGAYHLIEGLSPAEQARGVVTASAGNHGQGVAWSCARLGVHGRVHVPTTTPRQKRQRILALGEGRVELIVTGATYDEAGAAALADAERTGAVLVPPFDDARVVVGQGTIAPEIWEQVERTGASLHAVLVPVGGGGLIAGLALWFKERHPQVRLIGVEPRGAASMGAALAAGGPVPLAEVDTFVDGAAVARVGDLPFPLVRDLVDEVITIEAGAVCAEMLDLYQVEGIVAEPAGALASAAVRALAGTFPPEAAVVCLVSGGNNDVSRYGEILERALIHQGLRHYFMVNFPQQPGALRHFLDDVLAEGEDIVVFDYVKKNNRETGPALVGIELDDAGKLAGLLERMAHSPLEIEQIPPGSPLFSFVM